MKKYRIYVLTALRVVIGWHFLYEGIHKLLIPGWSAEGYLKGSRWIFSELFSTMADSAVLMGLIDFVNTWGLVVIGLFLFLGFLSRWVALSGAVLLLFYFVAYPPIPGYTFGTIVEGNYLWVNKNLIEFFILALFVLMPGNNFLGIDRLILRWKNEKAHAPIPSVREEGENKFHRREILKDLIGVPVLGAFAYAIYKKKRWDSFEEKYLGDKPDTVSGATTKSFNFSSLKDLKGQVPKGKIGNMELSRVIMGGNLIGGWAHARDLIYTSKLVKAYHTDDKVMSTLQLAEQCGINTILTNPAMARVVNKYWHETDGKIQFISDCATPEGFIEGIKKSEEAGAAAMYCQGGIADRLTHKGEFDDIIKGLELIRSYGKPAGIGAHRIETIQACVEQGIKPDFWVKTLHQHNYWSAEIDPHKHDTVGGNFKDNVFCFKPQETIDFMNNLEEPWIAFKILAAGALKPDAAFPYAFNSGADFICVGMYDFQIVEDCNIAIDSLANVQRQRPWRG
jgi:uncharacterized membrane protein YphA (DoxX/SURF4 family)